MYKKIPHLSLALIFILGFFNIFFSEGSIIIWPDSIGYIQPAFNLIEKNEFTHVYGRGFIYSSFVYFIVTFFGFNSIIPLQLGMLVAIYLICLLIALIYLSKLHNCNTVLYIFGSILLNIIYILLIFNGTLVGLAYTAMPEILFLLALSFIILIILNLKKIENKYILFVSVIIVLVLSFLLPLVKPHFIVAGIFLPLCILISIISKKNKTVLILAFSLSVFIGLNIYKFEKDLQVQYDFYVSKVFGPLSLFCNNANIIYPSMAVNARTGMEKAVADKLRDIVNAGPAGGWNVNKFDGDACTYGEISVLVKNYFEGDPLRISDFYFDKYFKSVLNSPLLIVERLITQFSALLRKPLHDGASRYKVDCGVIKSHIHQYEAYNQIYNDCQKTEGMSLSYVSLNSTYFFGFIFIIAFISVLINGLINLDHRVNLLLIVIFLSVNILIALVHTFDVYRYLAIQATLFYSIAIAGVSLTLINLDNYFKRKFPSWNSKLI